jgi:hypothetical protein
MVGKLGFYFNWMLPHNYAPEAWAVCTCPTRASCCSNMNGPAAIRKPPPFNAHRSPSPEVRVISWFGSYDGMHGGALTARQPSSARMRLPSMAERVSSAARAKGCAR